VESGEPQGVVDEEEPTRIADAAGMLGLNHVVVTSVTRDDFRDFGAAQFSEVVEKMGKTLPLSLSFDHRVLDGAEAAKFMNDIIRYLENPTLILMSF